MKVGKSGPRTCVKSITFFAGVIRVKGSTADSADGEEGAEESVEEEELGIEFIRTPFLIDQ
jgi:hypothetical protein